MSNLDHENYYALLGVRRDATVDEIRDAFHRFSLAHHPDNLPPDASEARKQATDAFCRGTEAYRVLLNPQSRAQYDAALQTGARTDVASMRPPGRSTKPPGPQIKSIKARPLYQRALQAIKKEDWKTARLNLQIALQYEPDHPLLLSQLRTVEQALK